MLQGCAPWPEEVARRYIEAGIWEGITVAEMVERTARREPGKTAVIQGETRMTYEELVTSAKRLASGLSSVGVQSQDRVVVQLPNCPEFVILYLALNYIGVIPVMALRAHRHAEIRHFLRCSGAVAYFIADRIGSFDYRAMAAEMLGEFSSLTSVIVVGEPGPGQTAFAAVAEHQPAAEDVLARRRPDPLDVSTMLLSGGTTSLSKLIPRTHNDYVYNARMCSEVAGFSAETVFLALLPLGHNYNLACPGMLGTFHAGGTLVIARSTDADEVFATVARERVTNLAAVVPLITTWLKDAVAARFDLSS